MTTRVVDRSPRHSPRQPTLAPTRRTHGTTSRTPSGIARRTFADDAVLACSLSLVPDPADGAADLGGRLHPHRRHLLQGQTSCAIAAWMRSCCSVWLLTCLLMLTSCPPQRSLGDLAYDIALACLLAVGVVFTADITRVSWGSRVRTTRTEQFQRRMLQTRGRSLTSISCALSSSHLSCGRT